ncbi:MAG: hypothetical protein M1348_02695 [Candidatus Parvarchaeota archaeon]|nr:hypothetical protein [Candidatus Parvarchaeota archaeon]
MNIKKTQGLQPADAGKYRHLKKKIAILKNQLRQGELKTPGKQPATAVSKEAKKVTVKKSTIPKQASANK